MAQSTIVFTVVDPTSSKAMGLFTLRDLTYRSLNRLEATAIILHLDASDRASVTGTGTKVAGGSSTGQIN